MPLKGNFSMVTVVCAGSDACRICLCVLMDQVRMEEASFVEKCTELGRPLEQLAAGVKILGLTFARMLPTLGAFKRNSVCHLPRSSGNRSA